MHVFSKHEERFVPNNQKDILDIIRSDEKTLQEYKKTFNREKVEGICRHLCNYIILNDLLIDKEAFSKAFEDKSSLIRNLMGRVQSGDITLCEEYRQRSFISSRYLEKAKKQTELINRTNEIMNHIKTGVISASNGIILIEKLREETKDYNEHPLLYELALKKPKMLTVADLKNLSVIDGDNNYKRISFGMHDRKKDGHALLIKKNSDDNFTFYDPNYGAVFNLTKEQLCELITQIFYSYKNTTTRMLNIAVELFSATAMVIHSILPEPLIPATLLILYCSRLTSQEYDTIGDINIDPHRFKYQTEQNNIEDVHVQPNTSICTNINQIG